MEAENKWAYGTSAISSTQKWRLRKDENAGQVWYTVEGEGTCKALKETVILDTISDPCVKVHLRNTWLPKAPRWWEIDALQLLVASHMKHIRQVSNTWNINACANPNKTIVLRAKSRLVMTRWSKRNRGVDSALNLALGQENATILLSAS